MLLQGPERKKLVSQEFLLKNVDQRFYANYFLQLLCGTKLFKICYNYWVFKNILGNNFWALLFFPSLYCHIESQPSEILKNDLHKNEGGGNGVFDKNTTSAWWSCICWSEDTKRWGIHYFHQYLVQSFSPFLKMPSYCLRFVCLKLPATGSCYLLH